MLFLGVISVLSLMLYCVVFHCVVVVIFPTSCPSQRYPICSFLTWFFAARTPFGYIKHLQRPGNVDNQNNKHNGTSKQSPGLLTDVMLKET